MGTVRYTVLDGEILSENRDGVKHDYVPDPLGSTVALLDNTQTQTDTYSFWPYGETRTSTGTTPTPFNFIGTKGYYADTAGISLKKYVLARYYDTFRSRWLTEDPIGFAGGDFNLYRYVKNNPTSRIDPSGLSESDCTPDCSYKKRDCDKLYKPNTYERCNCHATESLNCLQKCKIPKMYQSCETRFANDKPKLDLCNRYVYSLNLCNVTIFNVIEWFECLPLKGVQIGPLLGPNPILLDRNCIYVITEIAWFWGGLIFI